MPDLAVLLLAERNRRRRPDGRKWSQEDAAREIGCSLRHYSRLENGETADPMQFWEGVERFLGLSLRPAAGAAGKRPTTAARLAELEATVATQAKTIELLKAAVGLFESPADEEDPPPQRAVAARQPGGPS